MVPTALMISIGIATAAIVIALMMWKPRRRFDADAAAKRAAWPSRDVTFASMLLSLSATVGLARSQAEQSGEVRGDSGHGWHGSHLDHGGHSGFSDGGGGFSGGDSGGGGI